jgi:hypothetical protein
MAGESADAMVRRQKAKIARLERSAAMWERGAEGERATANALKALPPDTWTVLHDVRWPGRPFANIDHIAVGPTGVYVIDSKNWSGKVRLVDGVLRQNGRQRTREVLSATEATAAVCRRLPHLPAAWATPVLCIVSSDVAGWSGSAAVCHKANIVDLLTSGPTVLSPEVVHSVVSDLRLQLHSNNPAPRPPRRSTPSAPLLRSPRALPTPARRTRTKSRLVAPLTGLAIVTTLALSPQIITGVADGVGTLFTDPVDSGSNSDLPEKDAPQKQRQDRENQPRWKR